MERAEISKNANDLYYRITNACVEFDENEEPIIIVNDDNKNVVSGILGDVLDFLADIMLNK